jgi:large subunit ribosomal protein L25
MDQVELYAQPRAITGKKVKRLRAQGIIPLIVYGRSREPVSIQAPEFDARRALARSSGQLMALHIEGEDEPRMTLARDIQRDVITGRLLHIDLYEVDVSQKTQVEVSLSLVGEPHLVGTGEALLVTLLNAVEIECLPTDILQSIEVDASGLVGLDDAVYVRDLVVPDTIEILTDPDQMVARLEVVLEEEEEEEEEEVFLEEPSVAEVEVIQRGRVEEEEDQEEG